MAELAERLAIVATVNRIFTVSARYIGKVWGRLVQLLHKYATLASACSQTKMYMVK